MNEVDSNEQMSLLSNNSKEISKGESLEFRLKRLLYHMGYFTQTNVILKTAPQEPCDVITDLDVLGTLFLSDFSMQTTWVDCKSGKADILKHISWINGIKANSSISNAIFIKKGVRKTAKEYAQTLGIKVFDLNILEELEKKYKIEVNDWSGSYDYKLLTKMPHVFNKIVTPGNKHYKNIFTFYSSSYWTMDSFTQIKKCISGIKQLFSYYILPITHDEKLSVKWMIFAFINLFLLSTYKICGQIFYYDKTNKKEILLDGLMSGSIPVSKQNEIRNISFNMAAEIIKQNVPDFDTTIFKQISVSSPPPYFEAYYNLLLKISENPLIWHDVLRQFDYYMLEYEFKNKRPDVSMNIIFNDQDTKFCFKTILYFIIDATGISKDMFPVIFSL